MRVFNRIRCISSLRKHPSALGMQIPLKPPDEATQLFDPDDLMWASSSQFETTPSVLTSHDDCQTATETENPSEISDSSEGSTKKRSEIVEENRSDGHAPIKTASSILMQSLQKSSSKSTSLSDIDVTLFNFHSTKFAERLLNRNVSSVVIVESSHVFSKTAKKFAEKLPNVDAYRADIYTLLGVGRKKTAQFPKKLMFAGIRSKQDTSFSYEDIRPWTLNSELAPEITKYRRPHLLAVLPTPSIQKTILDSLMQHALLHLSKQDEDTVFRFGETSLLTFLSCGILSQYTCSSDDRLHFLSHQHRRHSALFQKLLNLKMLQNHGYPSTSFHPQLPTAKKMTHERKLAEVNLMKDLQYAVQISPQKSIEIDGKQVTTPNGMGEDLVAFGCFMNQIGRQPNAKTVSQVVRTLWPESSMSMSVDVLSEEKIGLIPVSHLESIFSLVHNELSASPIAQSYRSELNIKRAV